MKFIYEKEKEGKPFTLEDVEDYQFFIDEDGDLCQKVDSSSYNILANSDGSLYALGDVIRDENYKIKRILPKVLRIEF